MGKREDTHRSRGRGRQEELLHPFVLYEEEGHDGKDRESSMRRSLEEDEQDESVYLFSSEPKQSLSVRCV